MAVSDGRTGAFNPPNVGSTPTTASTTTSSKGRHTDVVNTNRLNPLVLTPNQRTNIDRNTPMENQPTQQPSHQLHQLKIKRKTAAAEARFIRHAESTALRRARMLNISTKPDLSEKRMRKYGLTENQIARAIKKRNASLVPNAVTAYARYNELHHHRTVVLRRHSRVMHLAHGFIKGMPYDKIEETVRQVPTASAQAGLAGLVASEVARFGGEYGRATDREVMVEHILDWLNE